MSLNSGPEPSFCDCSSALRASASTPIERNFTIRNICPSRPTRSWRKKIGPALSILIANAMNGKTRATPDQRGERDRDVHGALEGVPAASNVGISTWISGSLRWP